LNFLKITLNSASHNVTKGILKSAILVANLIQHSS